MSRRTKKKKKTKLIIRAVVAVLLYPFVMLAYPFYWLVRKLKHRTTPKGKFQDIVSGFAHMVVKDSEVEKLATKRAEICSMCPKAKYNGRLNTIMVGDSVHEVKGMYCDECGCALAAKVRSENDYCPLKKW